MTSTLTLSASSLCIRSLSKSIGIYYTETDFFAESSTM